MERNRPTLESHEEAFREILANWSMLNAYLRAIVRNRTPRRHAVGRRACDRALLAPL
jgi:hypothetical protein